MALLIWLPVATVNAIIFFLIDTPALYAIHRGLFALQGYYLHTRVRAGIRVQLVRSKVPIVGGELLHGTTGFPSIFVLFNVGALICLFFATLGVDAGTRSWWASSPCQYITTLSQPSNSTTSFEFDLSAIHNFTCKTGNRTHTHYWHAAFNASQEPSNNKPLVKNVFCQANAPHAQPILSAQCMPDEGETECLLFYNLQEYVFEGGNSSTTVHKISDRIELEELSYVNYTLVGFYRDNGSIRLFSGTAARIFSYRTNDPSRRKPAIFVFCDSATDSWFFSFGMKSEFEDEFVPLALLHLSLHGETAIDTFFIPMRSEKTSEFFLSANLINSSNFNISIVHIFERFLRHSLRAAPSSTSTPTFVKMSARNVTTLSTTSTVLYSIVIGFAILLFPIKELLVITLVRTGKVSQSQLFGYEYNEMSKNFRIAQEQLNNAPPSKEYAILNPTDQILKA